MLEINWSRCLIVNLYGNCSSAITVGNDILVGTKKGLYLFKDKEYKHLNTIDPLLNSPVISMTKDKDSAIWIATTGNGVLRLKNKYFSIMLFKNIQII